MRARYVLTAGLAILTMAAGGSAARAAGADTVTVQTGTSLGALSPIAEGLNASAYDGNLLDSAVPGLIRAAGVKIMRYPGGSEADTYHWQTNSITPGQGGYANPNDTFDNFMSVVHKAGAQAMITVNYGSNAAGNGGGDPNEAAAWVNYANNVKHYGVKYWEIGNEIYGNGYYYNAHWETDLHSMAPDGQRSGDPNLSPSAYANNAKTFIAAMKAKDPTIKIGLVLTAPGNWPDGVGGGNSGLQVWNPTVLSNACSVADFVAVHWYAQQPGNESDAGLLNAPENGTSTTPSIPSMVATLRSEINQYCGARASRVQIMVTETNSVSYNPGKQTTSLVNALFAADDYMTWLENGAANVDWWQLHNGPVTGTNDSSSLYGNTDYGDYGVLSNGQSPEPPANTPFPSYYGLQMVGLLTGAGGSMVWSSSSNPLITVHAVREPNGNLAVLLINKDPSAGHYVNLSLPGYSPASAVKYFYGEGSSHITTTQMLGRVPTQEQWLPPYSLTLYVFSQSS